ncbi:MAG: hypothetical protein GQ564_10440 [Bacteroidales bacterium]|nr:hypothetical protein [Bacteroidales bacterium]
MNKPMSLFSFFKNYRVFSIKRRLESKRKINEFLKYHNEYNKVPIEKVIEIVFGLQIPSNYRNLPDSYPLEIKRYYLRLNATIILITDLIYQYYETYQRITGTSKEDKELIKKLELNAEALIPLILQLKDLIKKIKKSKFNSSKNQRA